MAIVTIARALVALMAAGWAATAAVAGAVGMAATAVAAGIAAVGTAAIALAMREDNPIPGRLKDCPVPRSLLAATVATAVAADLDTNTQGTAGAALILGAIAELNTGELAMAPLILLGVALWGWTHSDIGTLDRGWFAIGVVAPAIVGLLRGRDVKRRPESGEMWLPARLTKLLYWEAVGGMATLAHLVPPVLFHAAQPDDAESAAMVAAGGVIMTTIAALWALDRHKSKAPAIAAENMTSSLMEFVDGKA